jgi:proline iminopeptidase
MPTTEINGARLFYTTVGSGDPCLTMHGGLGLDHTHLHPWLDPLGDRLRLVFYDHRGNGRSERTALETLTFEQFSADAEALRQQLGLGKVVLLGHSNGGFIALDYALRYPESISRLILISTAPAVDYWPEIRENMRRRGATAEMIESFESGDWTTDAELEAHVDLVGHLNFAATNEHLGRDVLRETIYSAYARSAAFDLLQSYDVEPRLGEISAPTLIVVGREDVFTPISQAERLHRAITASELVVIENAGHFNYAEQPDAFFGAVRSWLARLPKG